MRAIKVTSENMRMVFGLVQKHYNTRNNRTFIEHTTDKGEVVSRSEVYETCPPCVSLHETGEGSRSGSIVLTYYSDDSASIAGVSEIRIGDRVCFSGGKMVAEITDNGECKSVLVSQPYNRTVEEYKADLKLAETRGI